MSEKQQATPDSSSTFSFILCRRCSERGSDIHTLCSGCRRRLDRRFVQTGGTIPLLFRCVEPNSSVRFNDSAAEMIRECVKCLTRQTSDEGKDIGVDATVVVASSCCNCVKTQKSVDSIGVPDISTMMKQFRLARRARQIERATIAQKKSVCKVRDCVVREGPIFSKQVAPDEGHPVDPPINPVQFEIGGDSESEDDVVIVVEHPIVDRAYVQVLGMTQGLLELIHRSDVKWQILLPDLLEAHRSLMQSHQDWGTAPLAYPSHRVYADGCVQLQLRETIMLGISLCDSVINFFEATLANDDRYSEIYMWRRARRYLLAVDHASTLVYCCRIFNDGVWLQGRHDLYEMDALLAVGVEALTGMAGDVLGSIAEGLGHKVRGVLSDDHDSPIVMNVDPGAQCIVNVPKEAVSMGFDAADISGSHAQNFGQSANVHDILSRIKIPSLYATGNWGSSIVVGTEILGPARVTALPGISSEKSTLLVPTNAWRVTGLNPTKLLHHTAISWFSQFYRHWRGSLILTVEVLNTKFHQGQLWLCYQPQTNTTSVQEPSLMQSRNCCGATLDLSLCNRAEIKIPWNSHMDYKNCCFSIDETLAPPIDQSMGRVMMFVQNPLVGPATVAGSVDFNVWIRAADDFEMLIPRPSPFEYDINGVWEMDEVQVDAPRAVTAALPSAGMRSSTMREVPVDCNVRRAEFDNLTDREYLLAPGVVWTTSQVTRTIVGAWSIVDLFHADALSIRGLTDYHAYLRTGVQITLRMNAQPFFQGMLALIHKPADITISDVAWADRMSTFGQHVVSYFTPQSDTNATIKIPWTNRDRIMHAADFNDSTNSHALGSVLLVVFNPLRSGGGGGSTISGTLWGKLLEPYIGLKKARVPVVVVGAKEMLAPNDLRHKLNAKRGITNPDDVECDSTQAAPVSEDVQSSTTTVTDNQSSDSATKKACGGAIMRPITKAQTGHIRGDHMSVKMLMRRPDFVRTFDLVNADAGWRTIAQVPLTFQSRVKRQLSTAYLAWSGSLRWEVTSDVGNAANVQMKARNNFSRFADDIDVSVVVSQSLDDYNGVNVWKPGLVNAKVIQSPYYSIHPNLYCMRSVNAGAELVSFGSLNLDVRANEPSTLDNFRFDLYMGIGDDFNFYVPLPFAPTKMVVAPGTLKALEEVFKILTKAQQDRIWAKMDKVSAAYNETELAKIVDDINTDILDTARDLAMHGQIAPVDPTQHHQIAPVLEMEAYGNAVDGWIRDLTIEGVEPNPGPITDDLEYTDEELRDLDLEMDEWLSDGIREGPCSAITSFFTKIMSWMRRGCNDVIASNVKSKLQKLHDTVLDKILPVLVWATDFLLNIYIISTATEVAARMMAMSALAAKCVMTYSHGSELLEQLKEVVSFQEMEWPLTVHQSIAAAIASTLVAGLIALLGVGFCKSDSKNVRELTMWKVAESAASLSKINSGVRAAPELWCTAKSAIEAGLAFALEGKNVFDDWYTRRKDAIEKWQIEVDQAQVANRFDNNNIFKTHLGELNYQHLERLNVLACEIRAHQGGVRGFPVTWSKTAEKVVSDMARCRKAFDSVSGRVEPVGIWLEGTAGCGKSFVCTKYLPFIVMSRVGLVKNYVEAQRNIYTKPSDPEHKYMDGYTSQKWVACDDFAAGTEDKDALHLINLISVATCAVNMADLQEKRTIFDSRFICCTTNQKSTNVIEAVRDKSALIRRFPFALHMKPREAYKLVNGRINLQRATRVLEGCKSITELTECISSIWQFDRLNLTTGGIEGEMAFDEFVESVCELYRTRANIDGSVDMHLKLITQEMDVFDEITSLRPPEPRRVRLTNEFFDAVEDLPVRREETTASILSARIAVGMQLKRLATKEELDYATAQRILEDARRNIDRLGYDSWDELSSEALLQKPYLDLAMLKMSSVYSFHNPATFPKLIATLNAIVKPSTYAGPVKKPWPGLVEHLTIVCGIVGGAALIWGAYRLIKSVLSKTVNIAEGPHYDSNGKRQPFVKSAAVIRRPVKVIPSLEGDVVSDNADSIRRNIRRIEFESEGNQPAGMSALALDARTLVVPAHFMTTYNRAPSPKKIRMEVQNRKGDFLCWQPVRIEKTNSEVIYENGLHAGKKDAIVVRLVGCTVFHARDIKHKIMTRKDRQYYGASELASWWFSPQRTEMPCAAVVSFKEVIQFGDETGLPAVTAIVSGHGDCGRPYVIRNVAMQRPLIGIHVWGFDKKKSETGVADFSYEGIMECIYAIDARIDVPAVITEVDFHEMGMIVKDEPCKWWTEPVELHGVVSWNGVALERFQPKNTAFVRTELYHPEWTDDYAPSAKDVVSVGGQLIHPLYTHAQKFSIVAEQTVPLKLHMAAVEYMKGAIGVNSNARPLTEFEMINGIGDMKPIVLNTSTGYLQRYFTCGKTELFDALPQEVIDGEVQSTCYEFSSVAHKRSIPMLGKTFYAHLCDTDVRINEGCAPATLWTAVNKDELLEKRKVLIGKTRVFVQPGLELTLLIRKYFGHFVDNYKQRAGFGLCHGIGKDKDAVWGEYYRILTEVGEQGGDIDYKNYDGRVVQSAIDAFLVVTDHYYGSNGRNARHALIHSVTNSLMVVGGYLAETGQGNKSGNPCTDILNSITNWYNILVCYQVGKLEAGIDGGLADFAEKVRCLTYGDDVIYTAHKDVLPWFNRSVLVETLAQLGQEVTSADKYATIEPVSHVDTLTFLKSPFVQCNQYVAAPLPKKVIYREIMWEKKANVGNVEIFDQKIEMALRMMAHHGRDDYNVFATQLRELGVDVNFSFVEWENEMRTKQELTIIPGSVPRRAVNSTRLFLPNKPESDESPFPHPDW